MTKLIKVATDQGTLLIESALSEKTGKVVLAGGIEDRVGKRFDDLMKVIRPITETILKSVDDVVVKPSSISAEFGLSITAEGNLFVVRASGEASLKITFEWREKSNGEP